MCGQEGRFGVSTVVAVGVPSDISHKCARVYVRVRMTPLWFDTYLQLLRVGSTQAAFG